VISSESVWQKNRLERSKNSLLAKMWFDYKMAKKKKNKLKNFAVIQSYHYRTRLLVWKMSAQCTKSLSTCLGQSILKCQAKPVSP